VKRTVLITGAGGFVGKYMSQYLRTLSDKIYIAGIDLRDDAAKMYDSFYTDDLQDSGRVKNIIEELKPRYIIHLAGTFGTGDTQQIIRVNVLSIMTLLDAMLAAAPDGVFIAAGSAAEYGSINQENLPVTEEAPCNPVMPYGLSKYLATTISQYYCRVHHLCTMIVRPFQLIGKGVTDRLAPGAFAKRLLEAKQAGTSEIQVGNLENSRDFLDVRDAVRAIWMLCEKPKPGEIFNLCSGRPIKMSDLLDMMISAAQTDIHWVTDQSMMRGKSDVNIIYGNMNKIYSHCKWHPEIPLIQTIEDMFVKTSEQVETKQNGQ
jgi:GDP-4-dehydro-6-deoxy-D-mannose reductase